MAFTGAPTITSLGKRTVRFSGTFTLGVGATGTIKASGGGGDASLPASFPALAENDVIVTAHQVAAGAISPIAIAKDSPLTTISIINTDGANATGNLEIYVQAVHSIQY